MVNRGRKCNFYLWAVKGKDPFEENNIHLRSVELAHENVYCIASRSLDIWESDKELQGKVQLISVNSLCYDAPLQEMHRLFILQTSR